FFAMTHVRLDPLRELASMEIDRLNSMVSNFDGDGLARGWVPPVDIYETEQHELVIKAELPDMKREDIGVTFENSELTLKGERKAEQEISRDRFQRLERFTGSFSSSFTLPATVDASNISASYKDGLLTVRLPQRAEAKPKKIVVGE